MRTAGVHDRRRALAAALLIAPLAIALPVGGPAVRGAGESGTQILPGDSHSAVVVDLDADGVNEVVRIVMDDAIGHVVEAWGFGGDAWELLGTVPIPRLDASGAERGTMTRIDASAVLVWRADGRHHVLVLARWGRPTTSEEAAACCVTASELVRTGDTLALEPRLIDAGSADIVEVIDVDADGTDELVRVSTGWSGGAPQIEMLRWDGEAFASADAEAPDGAVDAIWTGDTDGVEGQDIHFGPTAEGDLHRMAWVDGALRAEEVHLDLGERIEGYVSGVAGDTIVLSLPEELRLVRWPRGEEPTTTARLSGVVYPYAGLVDAGSSVLLAIQEGTSQLTGTLPTLGIHGLDLADLGQVEVAPIAARVERMLTAEGVNRSWQRYLFPYSGPFHGARPEAPLGFVWGGVLVRPNGENGYEAQPIAPMLSLQPIGLAGPDDGWVALSSGYLSGGDVAYLFPGQIPGGFGRISLARLDDVLRPEGDAPTIELRNAVAVGPAAVDVTELVADGDGFEVVLHAPPESWVVAWNGRAFDELTVGDEPLGLQVAPPARAQDGDELGDRPIEASIIIATPDGHATVVEWAGTFARLPPALSVTGRTETFSFGATVEGIVGPHATVSVDGRPVAVGADGGFAASVEAGLWPRGVAVIARDVLGNEVVGRVDVLGLYDYRGLPWAAIAAVATVSVGAVLFMRIPRRRPAAAADDGRLEELDPADGATFGDR